MPIFCNQCGASNHESAQFCVQCGIPLIRAGVSSARMTKAFKATKVHAG